MFCFLFNVLLMVDNGLVKGTQYNSLFLVEIRLIIFSFDLFFLATRHRLTVYNSCLLKTKQLLYRIQLLLVCTNVLKVQHVSPSRVISEETFINTSETKTKWHHTLVFTTRYRLYLYDNHLLIFKLPNSITRVRLFERSFGTRDDKTVRVNDIIYKRLCTVCLSCPLITTFATPPTNY